jgi:glycerol-3-phosphate O-acyltransferase / dihydroxyacetone phosphate acyltransferase
VYALLRAIVGVALRWYYRDIQVEGFERIPRKRPLLLVVNHPNALVDALLVAWVMPRRVLMTAKSTIFVNPIVGALFRWLGVVPLQRASDLAKQGQTLDPQRNQETFRAVVDALRKRGTVLIFPEGKSHDEPSMAPLKTGAARMALEAASSGVSDLAILPIGLVFERKELPRSRVLVQIGEPIGLDTWRALGGGSEVDALTAHINARLRAVTLNYATADDAARAVRLASLIAALFEDVPRIGVVDRGLAAEAVIARRIESLSTQLPRANAEARAQAEVLADRLDDFQRESASHGIRVEDIRIPLGARDALRFLWREGWLLLIGGPIALWGRVNHWLPFRAARLIAMRSVESAADPAMRTLVAGAALVLLTYLAQTAAVFALWGPKVALLYLVSLPIAADINFYLSDRLRRAVQRARAFLRLTRNRGLQQRLTRELDTLREQVASLDDALGDEPRSREYDRALL